MARHPQQQPPASPVVPPISGKPHEDDRLEGLDADRPAPAALPAPAAAEEYTKAWMVSHPAFGGMRVLADDAAQAVAEFRRIRCSAIPLDRLEKDLFVHEIPFTPAATEVGKPGGFKRRKRQLKGGR